MAFYVLLGTAALHPSMRELTDKAPDGEERLTFGRLALLTTAALAPPVVRLVQNCARRARSTSDVLSAASIILFLLVVVRMAGLDPPAGALGRCASAPCAKPARRS